MPSHNHDIEYDTAGSTSGSVGGTSKSPLGPLILSVSFTHQFGPWSEAYRMLDTGGDQPHNNLHPYFAITFIIKN